jgi:hypothetical protein
MWPDCLDIVGYSASHNPIGLHGLLSGYLYFYCTVLLFAIHALIKPFHFTGNGAGFTKLFERLIRGVWTPTAMEFMQPSL